MTKNYALPLVATLFIMGSSANATAMGEASYHLRLAVPVVCTVKHSPSIAVDGAGYHLGDLQEFCNSARGYILTVNYAPGSLKGAVIAVGEERVTLDGSGQTIITRSTMPHARSRGIFAQPGSGGFDTDRLDFNIEAL